MTNEDQARRSRTLLDALRKFGAPIPPEVVKAEKVTTKALEVLKAMEYAATDQALMPAAAETLARGQDPLEAPEVQRAALARTITTSVNYPTVKAAAVTPLHEALTSNGHALTEALRPAFEDAANTLADARTHLGDVSLDDAAAVLALGGQAADAYRQVAEAEKVIRDAADILRQYHRLTGPEVSSDYHLLRWADADPDQWKAHAKNGRPYVVAAAGVPLSLADPAELAERVTRLEVAAREAAERRIGPAAGGIAVRTY